MSAPNVAPLAVANTELAALRDAHPEAAETDDLVPESLSYMRQARAILAEVPRG